MVVDIGRSLVWFHILDCWLRTHVPGGDAAPKAAGGRPPWSGWESQRNRMRLHGLRLPRLGCVWEARHHGWKAGLCGAPPRASRASCEFRLVDSTWWPSAAVQAPMHCTQETIKARCAELEWKMFVLGRVADTTEDACGALLSTLSCVLPASTLHLCSSTSVLVGVVSPWMCDMLTFWTSFRQMVWARCVWASETLGTDLGDAFLEKRVRVFVCCFVVPNRC